MFNFNYYTPTQITFGKGTEKQVGELVKNAGGTKVLIHYGGQSAVRSGLIDRIKSSLDEACVTYVELGGVVPNPHIGKIREGIELGKVNGVDFVLAVGGGSVIDSSKAIACGLAEPEEEIWELFEHTRKAKTSLPVGSVLTIAAAGSEMSNSCVITNEVTGEKRSYDDNVVRPKFAILNPELTMTLSDFQTACGCADMMLHITERYFTCGGNMEVTDGIAESLLRTIMKNAEILKKDPQNYEARAEVMWAGSLAHNGLVACGISKGDWVVHLMEHEMGGMFDVTHAAGLTAIWGTWARFVYKDCLPRFVQYALNVMQVEPGATDEETALKGILAMEDFYRRIGMPTNMRELGIDPTEEQIRQMADSWARVTGGIKGSAKTVTTEDIVEIYRKAK